ncbi:hypothetical protein [Symbiobacterium thermophilum]|uniref:Uncharacterized protein n=1 Tax=Symbiobacterium thermophilum TaxID=2734 RepID=A0A953LJP9_SYMTR|nr:hypothetical protein [Symbiobacterium thermophilum]MBY6278436.1 hypothetical protein [Symbiobacterium thermophilum]
MSSSDRIRVGEYLVERQVLDEIAQELRQYQHRRRRYEYLRLRYQQVPLESPMPSEGAGRNPGPSNPTLRAVERMESIQQEMAELAAWITTVDRALEDLSEIQREILRHLYLLPRSAREYTMIGLARRLAVSEREAYRARNEGLLYIGLALHGEAILAGSWQNPGRIVAGHP